MLHGRAGLTWIKLGTPAVHWPKHDHDYPESRHNPRHLLPEHEAYAREVAQTRRRCRAWMLIGLMLLVVGTGLGLGVLWVRGFDLATTILLLAAPIGWIFITLHRQDLMLTLLRRGQCLSVVAGGHTGPDLRSLHRRLHRRQRLAAAFLLGASTALLLLILMALHRADAPDEQTWISDPVWLSIAAVVGILASAVTLLRRRRMRQPRSAPRRVASRANTPRAMSEPHAPQPTHLLRHELATRRARALRERIRLHRVLFWVLLLLLLLTCLSLIGVENISRAYGMVLGMATALLILTVNSATIAFTRRGQKAVGEPR